MTNTGERDINVWATPAPAFAMATIESVIPRNGPTTAPAAAYFMPSLLLTAFWASGSFPATRMHAQTNAPANSMRMSAADMGFIAVVTPSYMPIFERTTPNPWPMADTSPKSNPHVFRLLACKFSSGVFLLSNMTMAIPARVMAIPIVDSGEMVSPNTA